MLRKSLLFFFHSLLNPMLNPFFKPFFHSAELGLKYVDFFFFSSHTHVDHFYLKKTEDHGLKRSMHGYTVPKDRCSPHSPC